MKRISVNIRTEPSEVLNVESGLQKLVYRFPANKQDFTIALSFPYLDCAGVWHPRCGMDRSNMADWSGPIKTMTSRSAPVVALFNDESLNRCTVAVSEVKELVYIYAGIREEDGTFHIKVRLPKVQCAEDGLREVTVWVDTRSITFSRALGAVSAWWEEDCGMIPMDIPTEAKLPMYSTWYSYHQMMEASALEEECRLAAHVGFRSVIVDDGWQTGDNNRGYAYCGDWKPDKGKFSDMKQHVANVHEIGMKYMLWYSVPFVGKNSQTWECFQNKMLCVIDSLGAGVLDPRYPDVREYLIQTYRDAVMNYDLDGLKLDFIDQFSDRDDLPAYNEEMDYPSVQPAVDRLMVDIANTLKKLKPNILLEFRQPYIGPNIRKYGNIFRVTDCPYSGISNRVGTVDLRLLSGKTAVHSDMLMWHEDEKPEDIALQLISSVFATVQISVLLEKQSEQQLKTLAFWLEFMAANQNLLLEMPLEAQEPMNLYPQVSVSNEHEELVALYSKNRIVKYTDGKKLTILNGVKCDTVYVEVNSTVRLDVICRDCSGEVLDKHTVTFGSGVHKIPAATGGVITLE